MDGVAIMRQLFVENSALTVLVETTNIAAGPLPLNTSLPAIGLQSISVVDRNTLKPGAKRHVTERVQATVLAANYPQMRAVWRAMRRAGADQMPDVPGVSEVEVHTDGAGPDFMDDNTSIQQKSQDFRVSFNELT